jgi:hypothetical protein
MFLTRMAFRYSAIGIIAILSIAVTFASAESTGSPADPLLLISPRLTSNDTPGWVGPFIGNQTIIETEISRNNSNVTGLNCVIVLEARDADGITVFLATKSVVALSGLPSQKQKVDAIWTADMHSLGLFELRTFALTDLDHPEILSRVYSSAIDLSQWRL